MDDLKKLQTLSWPSLCQDLDNQGYAVIDRLLSPQLCRSLAGFYDNDLLFRSRVIMARQGFGSGEYRYFRYPLYAVRSLPDWRARLSLLHNAKHCGSASHSVDSH